MPIYLGFWFCSLVLFLFLSTRRALDARLIHDSQGDKFSRSFNHVDLEYLFAGCCLNSVMAALLVSLSDESDGEQTEETPETPEETILVLEERQKRRFWCSMKMRRLLGPDSSEVSPSKSLSPFWNSAKVSSCADMGVFSRALGRLVSMEVKVLVLLSVEVEVLGGRLKG